MKKRGIEVSLILVLFAALWGMAVTQEHTNRTQIKHFTAFFPTEGSPLEYGNVMKAKIAEVTGADCEEVWLSGQSKENALNSYIASGRYPDFIQGEKDLYEADALIPIDEYWDEYPNIKQYMTNEQWDTLRQEDGHIYWIPQFGVINGKSTDVIHDGEAFWIQTRVLKWAGYPEIHTVDQYFDLLEAYMDANPTMENGTENIPFTVLCDDWRYFCLENVPQFLDGYPNDGCCMVDPQTFQVMDYNTTETARMYFEKLNQEYRKGILDAEAFTNTYEEYLNKLSTGAVLGMVDQWWQFYYAIYPAYERQNLSGQGCDYVPLPITMQEGMENQWHVERSASIDTASGLAITVSCADIDGALQFVNDLLKPEVEILRFWGQEGIDYSVDEEGVFYQTREQSERFSDDMFGADYFCYYSYFPRWEGLLPDGKNAFSPEYQPAEFLKSQPQDVQECLQAYGCASYVDMIGNHEAPGAWYPLYSYASSLSDATEAGRVYEQINETKHDWLPRVIMAEDFDAAWQEYMAAYDACEPQILRDDLQQEVMRRICE